MKGQILNRLIPKWIPGEGFLELPKYAFNYVFHIYLKSTIRGAVLFWMSDYRYLIKKKHKIKQLSYPRAV